MCEPLPRSSSLVVGGRRRRRRRNRRSTTVLARAADYVADYQTAPVGHRRRGALPAERDRHLAQPGRPSNRAVPRAALGRAAGQAGATTNRGCSSATCSKSTASRSAIATSASTSCSSMPRRIAREQAETIQARERALQHRPDACAPSTSRSWRCCSSSGQSVAASTFERGEAGNVKRFAELATADDVWMIEFRETTDGHDGQGRERPRHAVARPRLDRQRDRPHPAHRADQRRHRRARA